MSTYAHWKLNDNLASTVVLNEKGLNGILENAGNTQDISTVGKIDRALDFIPTTDRVDVGLDSFASLQGTVALWFKADNILPGATRYMFGRNDTGNIAGDFGLRLQTDGLLDLFIQDGVNTRGCESNISLADTNLHHIIITWSATEVAMYIDNVKQTDTEAGIELKAHANGLKFAIGNNFGAGSLGWDGLLEDVRLYDYEISLDERDFIYNSGLGTYGEYDEDYLAIAQYKCNDNASNSTVTDSSLNSLDGIIINDETNYTSEQSITGKINLGFDFDGINDYITLNDIPKKLVEKSFSVVFWNKPDQPASHGRIISFNTSTGGTIFQAGVNGSTGFFDVWDGSSHGGSININDNTWHWVTLLVDVKNQTINVYIDNGATADISFSFTGVINSDDLCSLCQEYDSGPTPSDFYKGGLDDVRFYNYLLPIGSRNLIYNGGLGTESSLPDGELLTPNESLGFSDSIELSVSNETIEINESLQFGDVNILDNSIIDEFESLGFSDTIELIVEATINESSKIISYNPLVIITDTDPVTIAKVDVSVPASPAWTRYIINVPPETVKNAKDITYNDEFGFLYITCADGQLLKVDITDFTIRTQIDTEDLNNLIYVDNLATHLKTYASTDNATGEIILIDEAEIKSIALDVRFLKQTNKTINLQANTVLSKSVALDARVVATNTSAIGLDIRFLKYDYSVVSEHPLDYTDWIVKINDVDMVPLNDIDMKSIIITHTSDNTSLATFTLHRQHDKLNYTNTDVSSEITNNNSVKVYIDGHLVFNGKVSSIITQSENEFVSVTAQMAMPASKKNKASIPLASVGEQLNVYHCLVDNVSIDNPYVNPNEENPEFYKGVKYDKGIEIKQKVSRWKSFTNVVDEISNGSFEPEQNWSYFWKATLKYLTSVSGMFGVTESITNARYIGTSLSPIGSDVIELTGAYYSYQRVYDDTEIDLGYGYIGSAPYLEVPGPNGKLYTMERWEDRYNGLYSVRDDSYDNLDIISRIAGLEYEKLQNINGDILPITQADIELSLNAYFYYDINLLTRVNITNTTTANIYKNLNGFPIAVKTIIISSNDMKVTLTCDNQKSQEELDAIDARYPEEGSGDREGYARVRNDKWDILSRTHVS